MHNVMLLTSYCVL